MISEGTDKEYLDDDDRYTEINGLMGEKHVQEESDHYDIFHEDEDHYIHPDVFQDDGDHYIHPNTDACVNNTDHYEECDKVKSRFDCKGTEDASNEFHTFKDF